MLKWRKLFFVLTVVGIIALSALLLALISHEKIVAAQEPGKCLQYVIQVGDILPSIATRYSVSLESILTANNMAEQDAQNLKIGDVLIIPLEGCHVVIANVMNWNDVANEAVELRNIGDVINLQGWTLNNEQGESFTFPEFRMFPGSSIFVYSRLGQNTPTTLYWGRDMT